jgi:chemotaxis signal transduction protein
VTGRDAVVTFRWDGAPWAFDVGDVVEIARARAVTPIPGTGDRLLGIVAWRGRTLPVVLPRRLKETTVAPDQLHRLLVLRHPAPFAVPVDEPGRVVGGAVEADDMSPPSLEDAADCVRRIVRVGGVPVPVLEPRVLVARGTLQEPAEGSDREESR